LLSKLTYANVMATIAVFIALGGASYAAIKLPKNSVGTEQLKKGAVNATKLSKAARATLAGDADPQGKEGPRGPEATPGKNVTAIPPLPSNSHRVITPKQSEPSADHCPGVGQAAPGFFCAYVGYELGASSFSPFENPATGANGTGLDGANAFVKTTAQGTGAPGGTWAVTAP
jgi:hypothetical protein